MAEGAEYITYWSWSASSGSVPGHTTPYTLHDRVVLDSGAEKDSDCICISCMEVFDALRLRFSFPVLLLGFHYVIVL